MHSLQHAFTGQVVCVRCAVKIRTEARRLQALMAATEERKLVLSKLEEINLLKQEAKQHSKTTYSNPLEQGEEEHHEPANLDSNFGVE